MLRVQGLSCKNPGQMHGRKGDARMLRMNVVVPVVLSLLVLTLSADVHALMVSKNAPHFAVESSQGEVSLKDYQGKKYVILSFYFLILSPD